MVIGEKTAKKLYKKTEETATKGFEHVSDTFIRKFFAKDDESVEEAKARLRSDKLDY